MDLYWKRVAPWVSDRVPSRIPKGEVARTRSLDDISVVGQNHAEGETSTEAMGRMVYKMVTGKAPRAKESQTLLSYLVHYAYGMFQGGLYGAFRGQGPALLKGGVWGALLWLVGDEFIVPLLGLQKGPTAVSRADHLNRLGAHLSYGWATAVLTKLFNQIF